MQQKIALFAVTFFVGPLFANQTCQNQLSAQTMPPLSQWRAPITHASDKGSFVASTQPREDRIKERQEFMENYIRTVQDTPEMEFLAAEGVRVRVIRQYDDNGTIPSIEVGGLGPTGLLHATMVLPVSGHCGIQEALSWAQTDTYSLYVEGGGKRAPLIQNARSLGMITVQEIVAPLQANQLLRITYYRSGSGGPGGYPSGRILEVRWDGT